MARRLSMVTLGLLVAAGTCVADTGAAGDEPTTVRLITLDPGHFHAALVQKTMYEGVAPTVHVYAPPGPDVEDHLGRIDSFNTRADDPTRWNEVVYRGADYLDRLLRERRGTVVVISGDNRRKADAILACAEAGLHVLADKPMCIDEAGFEKVRRALAAAARQGTVVYDMMTERSAVTTSLQRALVGDTEVFGTLQHGTMEEPAVEMRSVHHFAKVVAGRPLRRPAWYFDTTRQGEGIVDVTTHLVDLVMWTCFPGVVIDADRDVRVLAARRWPTPITQKQFAAVTGRADFPPALAARLDEHGVLPCYANGTLQYTIRDVHVRITVEWAFRAPDGAGDTHFSTVRGTRASLVVRQGAPEAYRPELYVEPAPGVDEEALASALRRAVARLDATVPGVGVAASARGWRVTIPASSRTGHEAHFADVMRRYLAYVEAGRLPAWETPNMIAKYATTTRALTKAREP